MSRLSFLWMTGLFASMVSAIEQTCAHIAAFEYACPFFFRLITAMWLVHDLACVLVPSITTQDLLLDLAAVATRIDALFASTTEAFVTWSGAGVLTTRQYISTNFPTTPSRRVVGINTTTCVFVLAAKASLCWPHVWTRWTRTCMTGELARMWTLPHTLLGTGVTTRVWWNTSCRPRIDLLLAPASVHLRESILWKITTWTAPLSRWWNIAVLEALLLCRF